MSDSSTPVLEKRPPLGELIVYMGYPWEVSELHNCNRVTIKSAVDGSNTTVGDNHCVPISTLRLDSQANLLAMIAN